MCNIATVLVGIAALLMNSSCPNEESLNWLPPTVAGDCAKIDLYVPRNSKLFVLIEAKAPWQKMLDRFESVASTYFNITREDY